MGLSGLWREEGMGTIVQSRFGGACGAAWGLKCQKTPISLLTPAVQGEGTMGLEPDQGGGAGDCFVWFVAFVWGVWLGYGSPHSPPSMCFCRMDRPLFTRQHRLDTRIWLSCWWPRKPIFRSRTT